jgi:hypothetical protein
VPCPQTHLTEGRPNASKLRRARDMLAAYIGRAQM